MDGSDSSYAGITPEIHRLRARWSKLTGRPAPPTFRATFLARAVAYAEQAAEEPHLAKTASERLLKMSHFPRRRGELKIGARLIRSWRGEVYEVEACADGFIWQGLVFASLTKVATAITGTHWNGPAFFGLRGKAPING